MVGSRKTKAESRKSLDKCGDCEKQLFRKLCCRGPPPVRPSFMTICLGLKDSGKSTLLAKQSGESTDDIAPTVGFSIKALMFDECFVDVKELGGADNVRPYWDRYYTGAQGVVFVVNSSCSAETMDTTIQEFHRALDHPELEGLPLLVLANYQDVPGARSEQQVSDLLKLTEERRPYTIQACTIADKSSVEKGFGKFNKLLLSPYDASNTEDFHKI